MYTSEPQWARLLHDANHGLRRGAWYRVAELTSDGAVLDVNRKRVSLPRTSLGLRSVLPQAWTVVRSEERRVGKECRFCESATYETTYDKNMIEFQEHLDTA